jgi:hypothetical protein
MVPFNAEDRGFEAIPEGWFTLVLYHPLGAAERAQAGMSSEGFDSGGRPDDEQTDGQVPTDMQLEKADKNWHRRGQWLADVPKDQEAVLTQKGRVRGHLSGDHLIDRPSRITDYSFGRFYDFLAGSRPGACSDSQQRRSSWPNGEGIGQLYRPFGRVHAHYSKSDPARKAGPYALLMSSGSIRSGTGPRHTRTPFPCREFSILSTSTLVTVPFECLSSYMRR